MTPEIAISKLIEGNRRFVSGHTDPHDLKKLRQENLDSQDPFASVLACSDSREPVELIFDQSVGDLFVARVAGNMITPEIVASLEFGVEILATKVILILGHRNCGAVKAAIAGEPVPGKIGLLLPYLRPAVDEAGPDPRAVTEANARIQARILVESSPLIAEKVKIGKLKVAAGYYDIGTGAVSLLD